MKNKIKQLLRENLLLEADNRQKIIKFGGSPELANWAHNISDKYSVWIANAVLKNNLNFENELVRGNMHLIVELLQAQNRPPINLKDLTYDKANEYVNQFLTSIRDWVENPNTPPVDLRNMTWEEAIQRAEEWHNQLQAGGEVENILGDDSEIINKFSNGYAWVLTKSNYCDKSQASMGHCAKATHSDMYLLRLIKGNEEFLTADWHPTDKYIIQLKGKQNTKPLPKYHPYIEWLIKSNYVKELRTNEGYKPETNFQLTDLPPNKIAELYKTKPSLFTDDQLYSYYNDPNIKPIMMENMTGDVVFKLLMGSPNKMQTAKELGQENINKLEDIQVFKLLASTSNKEAMAKLVGQENIDKLTSTLMLKLFLTNSYIGYTKQLIEILGVENIQKMGSYALRSIIGNSSDIEQAEEIFSQIKNVNVDSVYETINLKNLLRESLLNKTDNSLRQISDFVNFTKKYLDIKDDIKVALSFERTPDLSTTAYYSLKGFIKVYVKDRAIIDICRSIAHELVHHKQNIDGRLLDATKDGADGSDIENEANAKAGEIIRKYGKLHPELYQ